MFPHDVISRKGSRTVNKIILKKKSFSPLCLMALLVVTGHQRRGLALHTDSIASLVLTKEIA